MGAQIGSVPSAPSKGVETPRKYGHPSEPQAESKTLLSETVEGSKPGEPVAEWVYVDDGDPVFRQKALLIHNLLSDEECGAIVDMLESRGMEACYGYRAEYRNNGRIKIDDKSFASVLWERCRGIIEKDLPCDADEHPQDSLPTAESIAKRGVGLRDSGSPERDDSSDDKSKRRLELKFGRICRGSESYRWAGPASMGLWKPIGLNEMFRACQYMPGGHFSPHADGFFERSSNEQSLLTFMMYLNDVPEGQGGCTRFFKFAPMRPTDVDGQGRVVGSATDVVMKVRPRRGTAIVFPQGMMKHDGEPLGGGGAAFVRFAEASKRKMTSGTGSKTDACAGGSGSGADKTSKEAKEDEVKTASADRAIADGESDGADTRGAGAGAVSGPATGDAGADAPPDAKSAGGAAGKTPVAKGLTKYILRSDVMYTREPGGTVEMDDEKSEALRFTRLARRLEGNSDFEGARRAYSRAFKLWPDLEKYI